MNFMDKIENNLEQNKLDSLIIDLYEGKLIDQQVLEQIIKNCANILEQSQNVIHLSAPQTICGDLRGQFYDLIEIFEKTGGIPKNNYLFLGNYVCRGFNSVETISLLAALKLRYPEQVTLLKGFYETYHESYGFKEQFYRKYCSELLYKSFIQLFKSLPLAAIIENEIFCVHSGIPSNLIKIGDIQQLDRFSENCNLDDNPILEMLYKLPRDEFQFQDDNIDHYYSIQQTKSFLQTNNLKHICRSHTLSIQGYEYFHKNKVISIFSAPNECFRKGNLNGVLQIQEDMNLKLQNFPQSSKYEEKGILNENVHNQQPQTFLPSFLTMFANMEDKQSIN